MIRITQLAMDVCWDRRDEQGRESMILCNRKRQTDGATRIYYTDRSRDPQTDRPTNTQTDRPTDTQTDRPPTDRQTDTQTDRQTGKQNRSVQIISDAMQRSL